MNILFTSSVPFHPLMGGIGRVTDTLCKSFLQKGHHVWYMHHECHNEELKGYSYPAPVSFLPYPDGEVLKNHQFYVNFLNENQIDVIICQDALYDLTFHQVDNLSVKVISVIV